MDVRVCTLRQPHWNAAVDSACYHGQTTLAWTVDVTMDTAYDNGQRIVQWTEDVTMDSECQGPNAEAASSKREEYRDALWIVGEPDSASIDITAVHVQLSLQGLRGQACNLHNFI